MEKQKLEQFKKDYEKFVEECTRVANKLAQYDPNEYGFCEFFYLDGDNVCSEGDEYWNFGGHEHHSCNFDISLLSYSNRELDSYVNNLIKKREDAKLKERQKIEEQTKKEELETLKRLKEKYENQ